MTINKLEIDSFTEYTKIIEVNTEGKKSGKIYNEVLYRGQQVDKSLLPRLGRINSDCQDLIKLEENMLRDFKKNVPLYIKDKPENNWDWLVLAQHHGLPTRLLDWSLNPLVALWFTVAAPPLMKNNKLQNGIVWMVKLDNGDFLNDIENYNPLEINSVHFFRPKIISKRVATQSGVFSVHKIFNNNQEIELENTAQFNRMLTKIVIPHTKFALFRDILNDYGINHSTMFPDIDGLCRHIEWKYSNYENKKASHN